MQKTILFLFLIASHLCSAQSKNEFQLKIQYNPETSYNQTMDQTSHIEMKYSGDPEIMQKIKGKGIQNPTVNDSHSIVESVYKTGKLSAKKDFPLTIEFLKTTNSDNKITIPNGTIIYGKGTVGNMPTLDSIVSNGLSEEFKKNILQTMQATFAQINIPERKVKVGEVFALDTPLSIPMAGVQLDMTITTTYKLLNIKNNIADFDISQVYTMKSSTTKFPMNAAGTGKGKLLYDVINNFNLKYQMDMEMSANVKNEKIELDIISKSGIIQTARISKT
ncbi:hypothetical protein SAMN05443549_108133 [Flavobacterium fluvii]|uniref:Uncharacterized protein n=1 Tax=Flavobacterium fluvii TaxID=468056 RepID=A0A1M5NRC6_9FLAO|nr:hypothetical protein [Flavobacterium fluvii]SHG92154.1 hypothetical protein SAMN05443549_108133 [Flavobacterium fluvii]